MDGQKPPLVAGPYGGFMSLESTRSIETGVCCEHSILWYVLVSVAGFSWGMP